jgi:Zn-dependent peptidase ImmA (M78 family)
MVDRARVTPEVVKWARETAKFSIAESAQKMKVPVEKIKEWESGASHPTIAQGKNLAKLYKRPFALFFLPEIPSDFQPLQDYRNKGSKALTSSSVFIIREIRQKQAWLREYFEETRANKLDFVGAYSADSEPSFVADNILSVLEINPLRYKNNNPILEWIEKAEAKRIFVSRTSFIHSKLKLDGDELQGFAIADSYAPFVFINSEDWNSSQLFTLVHELVHIWINESGISNNIDNENMNDKTYSEIEKFCNEVAAIALMPTELFDTTKVNYFGSFAETYALSKKLGVSVFALLIRAYKISAISSSKYNELRALAEVNYLEFIRKEEAKKLKNKSNAQGGPNYYLLQVNRNSRLFTRVALDAFRGGSIEATVASSLLNMKSNKFSKLEAFI